MTRTSRTVALVGAVTLLVAGRSLPTAGFQQTPPTRTIAGAGEVSSIDFVVLGRDGQPLLDLKPEEISLKIAGKTHGIKTLKLIKFSSEASAAASDREPPPPPFGTNAATDAGRAVVLVVEDESIRSGNEPPMRTAIAQFLSSLAPRDQVALVTVPHGSIKLNFTSDHDAVRKAVSEISGQAPRVETVSDAACRTRFTLQKMVETIETLGRGVGPTTFVLFSSSMMSDRTAVRVSAGNSTTGGANVGMCDVQTDEFARVNAAATAARANLFIIQHDPTVATATPSADVNNRGLDNPRAGLETLAGYTGGTVMNLSDTALPRIARETSAYYMVTFDTEPGERDGSTHQMSIKVNRDGASVRTRPDAFIAKADPSASRQTAVNPTAMMMDSRVFTDLPMRVTGYTARNTSAGELKIVALGEIVDPGVNASSAAAGLFDQSGRLIAQWTAQPSDTGRPIVMAALVAPPGTYRLRMAITDGAGRRGTADTEVTSELIPAGPLKLSAMVLGLSRNNGSFQPKLEFRNEAVALANFEVYGAIAGSKLQVVLEISQTLNGPAFLAMPAVASRTGEDDRFAVTAAIPLEALPPDDYVIRAIVSAEGQPEGRVVRTLRKTQ